MKKRMKLWSGFVLRLGAVFHRAAAINNDSEEIQTPVPRLFGGDQLARHGKTLAETHRPGSGLPGEKLLKRLAENERLLLSVHASLIRDAKDKCQATPAEEWLLDNFYVIEGQIHMARKHFPEGYSRGLPCLSNTSSAGLPRVYDIALETITHGDGGINIGNLGRILAAYQSVVALKLGELWAFPIMLRLSLIENIARNALLIAQQRKGKMLAEHWAEHLIGTAEESPKKLIAAIAEMAEANPPLTSSFVAEFTRRLHGLGAALAMPLTWIEQQLAESGLTGAQLIDQENQRQAANQVSLGNCITSIRTLAAMDWKEFVETMSVVEQTLRRDVDGVYARMDFATRDRYRHVVEKAAKTSPCSENEIAEKAIALAAGAAIDKGAGDRTAHVGFYLIGDGFARLEREIGTRRGAWRKLAVIQGKNPLPLYAGAIALLSLVLAGAFAAKTVGGVPALLPGILSLFCAVHLATAMVNWLATLAATPAALPRMDFSKGIPREFRTLVAIPALLTREVDANKLVDDLEVRFLANRDDSLHFCLLTDFPDADKQDLPGDESLLRLVRDKINSLNDRYKTISGDAFFLFHRPRLWNPEERLWMGFERKRGKLADLNQVLRHGLSDKFSLSVGEISILSNVKYVVTLDADTKLAQDSVWQFVGAMAHPLNRPGYDKDKRRVTAGYGILQPRVTLIGDGGEESPYAGMCAGEIGMDPYTQSVSDVYQDLFAEGSFIGKGIYDIEAFEETLGETFPKNRILSHDLLEGCYARSGLLSDVQLYEAPPAGYIEDLARKHRWIRGDWQIASWLFPMAPGPDSRRRHNPLSLLSRWKIADNLRRSLTATALLAMLILGWLTAAAPGFWTMAVCAAVMLPTLLMSVLKAANKPDDPSWRRHLWASLGLIPSQFNHLVLQMACLPVEALSHMDAIFRTAWRMLASHRLLLQWNPSGARGSAGERRLGGFIGKMIFGPLSALMVLGAVLALNPDAWLTAAPLLSLWFLSPIIAWRISQTPPRRESPLGDGQRLFLRRLARRTWNFFDVFVAAEDNWLPPDNHQEQYLAKTAHRTSPTNIGLSLLANLSAYDFGVISAGRLMDRTAKTFAAMERLRRHRGHFLNWYDTRTLEPLLPLYVSSVDSGNLSGHLLTLLPGLTGLSGQKIVNDNLYEGLLDVLGLVEEGENDAEATGPIARLAEWRARLTALIAAPPATLASAERGIRDLAENAAGLAEEWEKAVEPRWHSRLPWLQAFVRQCRDNLEEISRLAPWVGTPESRRLRDKHPGLDEIMTLDALEGLATALTPWFKERKAAAPDAAESDSLDRLLGDVVLGSGNARARKSELAGLAKRCGEFAQMEYDFLYDKSKGLLSIGYNLDERKCDPGCYDLLASEARLAAFLGVSQRLLPAETWFAMGRLLTSSKGAPILLSWSGSMFEYLMPLLVMPTYARTLLHETCKSAVAIQIAYGGKCSVPWGISESGYNLIDASQDYQYRSFGVPGLGLKRGLSDDLVIAPYASAMALMVAPVEACRNLERLAADGVLAKYGFYEAVDYTPSHLPKGKLHATVRSFMAHHQGMTLLSLAYALLRRPMQERFMSNPAFKASSMLLRERMPDATASYAHTATLPESPRPPAIPETSVRNFNNPNTASPEVQLLSNGRYHVLVTNAGGSHSRWLDLDVTRWREDATRDNWGMFCYLRDVASGNFWSNSYQPTQRKLDRFEAVFSEGRVEFHSRLHGYDVHTEIAVSPEDDIELRRLRITNRSKTRRTLDVTSFAETALVPHAADMAHPAFGKLFAQTEILRKRQAILCSRRPSNESEKTPCLFHMLIVYDGGDGLTSYETNRLSFLGRGCDAADPLAMRSDSLSNGEGSTLDPIVAIRRSMTLEANQTATVHIVSGMGDERRKAIELVEKYSDRFIADRVFDLAWTYGQVLLRQLNASESDAQIYNRLAGSIVFANASLRAESALLAQNRRGQSGLWGFSISGDLPLVLLRIEDPASLDLARLMLQAHVYWRRKGLAADLLIWIEGQSGYRQLLHERITELIGAGLDAPPGNYGGVFLRQAGHSPEEDRVLIQATARVIVSDQNGALVDQLNRKRGKGWSQADFGAPQAGPPPNPPPPTPRPDLLFHNGLGGFTKDGREYIIETCQGRATPAPWVNVIANPTFGTMVSESGMACSWAENAHEFRLTPWENDPVTDSRGELFFIRDEETGHFWSPTPLPAPGSGKYLSRHGFGYSVFEHDERGVYSELSIFVAVDAPIKFFSLKIRNDSNRPRRLSATGYVEWILGEAKAKSAMHVVTGLDRKSGALTARNSYNTDFGKHAAFFDVDAMPRGVTGDRSEFIGRNGSPGHPAGMSNKRLSGKLGAGLDPCGALRAFVDLAVGEERSLVFKLGAGKSPEDATAIIERFQGLAAAGDALDAVHARWRDILGAVQVETPDPAFDVMANGWLLYQTVSCRLWGRSAAYQSGGAFGFRDQLQDVLALLHARPDLTRQQLLLSAAHQFPEGDVQHWWHPPTGRGVRTRCSDDYLWLPFATCRYVFATGDAAVLDEKVGFIQGRPLKPDEESCYDLPAAAEGQASLYEHCALAVANGLKFGAHGLPLMGSGDWNDGMDQVGRRGQGESVWLGFFLYQTLAGFAKLADGRGDANWSGRCSAEAERLRRHIDAHGWDGAWYLRAYFDNGSPLGSAGNLECRIDSIAQSWSILSDCGRTRRSAEAMDSAYEHLVDKEHGLIKLFAPPFDKTPMNPGYIKGYSPGVRENGGQYTHAAVWLGMAYAKLGDRRRAWELYEMLNPVNHARTNEAASVYMTEPYAMAADVYASPQHVGRGGWSWYTGSAAWMYRFMIESLLGLTLVDSRLSFAPCPHPDWKGFKLRYRFHETFYHMEASGSPDAGTSARLELDGAVLPGDTLPLANDRKEHWLKITFCPPK